MSTKLWFKVTDDDGKVMVVGEVSSYHISRPVQMIHSASGSFPVASGGPVTIEISGNVVPTVPTAIGNLKNATMDKCECGVHKATGALRGPAHSSWCPWSKA